jgi:hypothetical protein
MEKLEGGDCVKSYGSSIENQFNNKDMEMHSHWNIGLLCVQENVVERPTMASVVLMLNSFSLSLPVPSQPAFFMHSTVKSDVSSQQECHSEFHLASTNEASITELHPR